MSQDMATRWQHIERLLLRTGPLAQADFEPSVEVRCGRAVRVRGVATACPSWLSVLLVRCGMPVASEDALATA